MRRPAGVTAAAVVLGLMTAMGLLGCVFAVLGIFLAPPVPSVANVRIIMAATDLLMLAWCLFCAWTVVGLFRMQRWARYAILVIGGCVAAFSGIAAAGMLLVRNTIPPPAPPSPVPMNVIFAGIAGVYASIALVGVWWLVYFNLRSVRAAFAGVSENTPLAGVILPSTPASITPQGAAMPGWRIVIIVWAWLMLVSLLYFPVLLMMHLPIFLFGFTLRGAAAAAVLLVLLPVQVYLGIGLLKKWKAAWYVGLLWQIYSIAVFAAFLVPGVWARFVAYDQELATHWIVTGAAQTMMPNMRPFMVLGVVFALAIILLLTTALVERRHDYLRA